MNYKSPLNIQIYPGSNNKYSLHISCGQELSAAIDIEAFADHLYDSMHILKTSMVYLPKVGDIYKLLGNKDQLYTLSYGTRNLSPNNFIPNVPAHELIMQYASANPSHPALQFEGQSVLTYTQLDELASDLAKELIVQFGVISGSKVPLFFKTSFELIVSILAIMKAGGAFVPLGDDLPDDRLLAILEMINASVLICGEDMEERATVMTNSLTRLKIFTYSRTLQFSPDKLCQLPSVKLTHLVYILFTSGTTGIPNAVGVEHGNLLAFLYSSLGLQLRNAKKQCLLLSPYTFDIGIGDIMTTLISGGTLHLVLRHKLLSNLPHWLEVTKTTHLSVTPSIGRLIPMEGLPNLTHIIFGGEKLPLDLAIHMSQKRIVINGCGPTEATIHASAFIVPRTSNKMPTSNGVPIGYPLGTTKLYILRPYTMDLTARGEIGEICIGGPQVSQGYLYNADLTHRKFVPDIFGGAGRIFRTGDLGRWNQLGQLEIQERIDNQIKFHGLRIEVEEIQRAVISEFQLTPNGSHAIGSVYAFVIEYGGEQKLVGIISWEKQGEDIQHSSSPNVLNHLSTVSDVLHDVQQACAKHLPSTICPSTWVCLDYLPVTVHGKMDQKLLNKIALNYLQMDNQAQPSSRPLASHTKSVFGVLKLLARILSKDTASIDTSLSFVELGGTSIHAMRFTTALQKYGHSISIIDVLNIDTSILKLIESCHISNLMMESLPDLKYKPFSLVKPGWKKSIEKACIKEEDIEDIYPCNSLMNYWLQQTQKTSGNALLCQFHHVLGKEIDPLHFIWCWEQICKSQPALRTVFIPCTSENKIIEEVSIVSFYCVVLSNAIPNRAADIDVLNVANSQELQNLVYNNLFQNHHLQIGIVPVQAWLILVESEKTWYLITSRHHALHDVQTLDLHYDLLNLLYTQGPTALSKFASNCSSFGEWLAISSNDSESQELFWKNYLQDAHCSVWPSSHVPQTFSKDLMLYTYHIRQWNGDIANIACQLQLTPGAILRGAYGIALAEGAGITDTMVFEVVDAGHNDQFTNTWGCFLQIKPTRFNVPLHKTPKKLHEEKAQIISIIRQANLSHISTLPYLGLAWESSVKYLKNKAEANAYFLSSVLNILDLRDGNFRKDMQRNASKSMNQDEKTSLFRENLVNETIRGAYLPIYVVTMIEEGSVTFMCPYDSESVHSADMAQFVDRQIEILELLQTEISPLN
ncbi:hypothetical protein FB446DRAFT_694940 [Lentinula raphanica]|nr:hypothetical protein FB446DRAFT_694940 [Lentinula raphanica]